VRVRVRVFVITEHLCCRLARYLDDVCVCVCVWACVVCVRVCVRLCVYVSVYTYVRLRVIRKRL